MPLNGKPDAPLINFIQFRIVEDSGKVTLRYAWVTDLVPTTDNIVQLVRAGRARWKIENEGFNTLKNQGYHLEHNFGHGDQHLSEAFFTPGLLAFFMHQIFELVDGLYQRVRTFFSSRRAFWDEVRSAFRLFLFTSWDQVLVRMNSPPVPLPRYQERYSASPGLDSVPRAAASRVPTTMQRNFAGARSAPRPRRPRLAQPILTRNPLLAPPAPACRPPSPPLRRVAPAKRPLQAVNHRSPRIAGGHMVDLTVGTTHSSVAIVPPYPPQ